MPLPLPRLLLTRRPASGPWLRAALIAALAIGAAPSSAALAATYVVAPHGNDANPGTASQPFKTIQRAANIVNPGDTVIVEDGTYTGTGAGTSCASSKSRPVVCLARGGTASAPITFMSRNPLGAKIDGANNTSTHGFRFLSGANYIRIEGFDVFGMGSADSGVSAFQIYSGGSHVEIVGNAIHDIGRLCTDHVYGMSAVFVQNAHVSIERNVIYNIGRFAPGESGCSTSTNNYQNHDHGVYVSGRNDGYAPGASNVRIVNNRFWDVQRGWAVQVYPDPVANLHIVHNTFANPNPYRTGHIILAASTSNGRIVNNIFFEPTTAGINFSSGTHTGLTVASNLSSREVANASPSGVTFSGNLTHRDPEISTYDYSIYPSSPAVDAGVSDTSVKTDIDGVPRPSGAASDIGADEQPTGTTTEPPPPPSSTPDTTPPVLRITSPLDGESIGRRVTITATASDDVGVAVVSFFVDGMGLASDTDAPYSARWDSRRAARGSHTITVVARDAAGNMSRADVTVVR